MPTDKLGAHVSTAGGTHTAPARAKAIDATAMQIFTKQANQWRERQCEVAEVEAFKAGLAETQVVETCAHDSYLINLASPKPDLRAKSIESFVCELQRCEALGLNYLVSHPGNYMDDRESGIARNAEAIGIGLERVPGKVMLLMETTAGTGTVIGWNFEELAALLEQVPAAQRHRVGVCMDTCHIFAAGYDLVNDYDGVMRHFGDTIGFDRLKMMHLNDSKFGLGTKKDRHELIAEGALGEKPFRRIMTDERLQNIAKVIETPKLDDPEATDRRMLERLRSYAA
jgi:deoxyribonuclease-4